MDEINVDQDIGWNTEDNVLYKWSEIQTALEKMKYTPGEISEFAMFLDGEQYPETILFQIFDLRRFIMNKKEMKAVVYPLTAEEFKQSEKITSEDVLSLINEADVEVE